MVHTDLLGVAGELALILALVVDAARIDIAAALNGAASAAPPRDRPAPDDRGGNPAALLILPGLSLAEAVILATLLAPTDAALGAVVVNSAVVPRRIRQALNVESGLRRRP